VKLDCRKEYLRPATTAQNGYNYRKPRNDTSGYKGVRWANKRRWVAMIGCQGQEFCFGYFIEKDEAAYVYDQVALQLQGARQEFARASGRARALRRA